MSILLLEVIESERDFGESLSVDDLRTDYLRIIDSGEPDFERLLFLGKAFEDFDLAEEALNCYSRIISVDGGHAEGLARRGNITFGLFVARDVDGSERELVRWAVSDFEKAVRFSGKNFDYVRMLALGLLMLGNYDRARKISESGVSELSEGAEPMSGVFWDLLYVLGYSQLFLGLPDEALVTFRRLAAGGGVAAEGWFGQAVCLWKMGRSVEVTAVRKELPESLNERLSVLLEGGVENYLAVARALL